MKAIVIGRHKMTGNEGLEVIDQRNINFPATSDQCNMVVYKLLQEAITDDAGLVFQMMPGQLAVACASIIGEDTRYKIGVIINRPGERPSGEILVTEAIQEIEDAVRFVNPRAKMETDGECLTITVDPPLRFEFSHIEWF